jgi:glutaredoxin
MNFFESIFLDLGLSWTTSKLIPYILMSLLGFVFVYTFHNRIQQKWKKWTIMSILAVLPFSIYFSIFPIYTGDFVNNHYSPEQLCTFPKKTLLTVVVLPGCPYCHETVRFMNELLEREPSLNIRYMVVAETNTPLFAFRQKLSKRIRVEKSVKPKDWIMMARGGFPTMILSENHKIVYAWENDQFGVRAIDDFIQRSK